MLFPLPHGFTAASEIAGIKPSNSSRPDVALAVAEAPYSAHALFTRNKLVGAHIPLCREHLRVTEGRIRAVLVNSGNANCATGVEGIHDAKQVCTQLSSALGCKAEEILFMST